MGFPSPNIGYQNTNLFISQASVYIQSKKELLGKLQPFISFGYSSISLFRKGEFYDTKTKENVNYKGLNISAGTQCKITNKVFTSFRYNFTKIEKNNSRYKNSDYLRNIEVLKLGIGYKI